MKIWAESCQVRKILSGLRIQIYRSVSIKDLVHGKKIY